MIRFGQNTREFEAAVRTHSSDVFRYAYWLCRDRSRAEDVMQESFARAWKSWADQKDRGAVKAWLFSIVRNEHLRGFQRKHLEIDDRDVEDIDLPVAHAMDVGVDVRRALGALPASLREPLMMQVLGGFTCAEIANALETTEGAIMTRLTRARLTMRRLVEGDFAGARQHDEAGERREAAPRRGRGASSAGDHAGRGSMALIGDGVNLRRIESLVVRG